MKCLNRMLITLAVPLFLAGPAMLYAAADVESGFLPDYSRLKSDPDYPGSKDWLNPDAKLGHYNAIIIDPVTVHLSPGLVKDGVRPDAAILNQVTEYFHGALTREFKKQKWNVVDAAGDNVTRYRAAITGISAEGGLDSNPLHYVPAVFLVRAASGKDSKKANINMESYYTDSVTGQTLAEVIQAATGKSVSGDQITLDNLKGAVDKWAKKAAEGFTKARNQQQ
jgi:hypothetical protein